MKLFAPSTRRALLSLLTTFATRTLPGALLIFYMLITEAHAGAYAFYCSKTGFKFHHKQVWLLHKKTPKSRLYFINNISKYPIWLNHEKKHPSASAGWASLLKPNRWSAILITEPKFYLSCQLATRKHEFKRLNCRHVLHVCQSTYYQIPRKSIGSSYWVAENIRYKALTRKVQSRGFKPYHKHDLVK